MANLQQPYNQLQPQSKTRLTLAPVAHLGGPEAFGHTLWREMTERRVPEAYDKVWIGDGAPWL